MLILVFIFITTDVHYHLKENGDIIAGVNIFKRYKIYTCIYIILFASLPMHFLKKTLEKRRCLSFIYVVASILVFIYKCACALSLVNLCVVHFSFKILILGKLNNIGNFIKAKKFKDFITYIFVVVYFPRLKMMS